MMRRVMFGFLAATALTGGALSGTAFGAAFDRPRYWGGVPLNNSYPEYYPQDGQSRTSLSGRAFPGPDEQNYMPEDKDGPWDERGGTAK